MCSIVWCHQGDATIVVLLTLSTLIFSDNMKHTLLGCSFNVHHAIARKTAKWSHTIYRNVRKTSIATHILQLHFAHVSNGSCKIFILEKVNIVVPPAFVKSFIRGGVNKQITKKPPILYDYNLWGIFAFGEAQRSKILFKYKLLGQYKHSSADILKIIYSEFL